MKKVFLFSFFLLFGLIVSQVLPPYLGEHYVATKSVMDNLMFICLAFIMINVGREFELDKTKWRGYVNDYIIAMLTAAAPWIFVAVYFMFLLPASYLGSWDAWRENLLLSRFAAPTSAGILFTMLAAAGLKKVWIYQKTQVLAIFDDLDTILLMIPLQIMMIGFKWQLFVILLFVFGLIWFGWAKLGRYNTPQASGYLILYSILIVGFCSGFYLLSKYMFGADNGVHLEVLLPAFVLGMVMKTTHHYPGQNLQISNSRYRNKILQLIRTVTHPSSEKEAERISDIISYLFMFLVGLSTPIFIHNDLASMASSETTVSVTASQPMMSWGMIALHVVLVTLVSNIGKLFPMFFYRDRNILERLALSIGMFTRGEVGAGILIIAIGYNLGGPALIIAILSLVLNLVLTGGFVVIVKRLARKVYGQTETEATIQSLA